MANAFCVKWELRHIIHMVNGSGRVMACAELLRVDVQYVRRRTCGRIAKRD